LIVLQLLLARMEGKLLARYASNNSQHLRWARNLSVNI